MSLYQYRLLKSSWGIAIDVIGNCVSDFSSTQSIYHIIPKLSVQIPEPSLNEDEVDFIIKGFEIVSSEILSHAKNCPVQISIESIWFNPTDYQEEGLTFAVIGWAANEFGFEEPAFPVYFDKEENRYVYSLLQN